MTMSIFIKQLFSIDVTFLFHSKYKYNLQNDCECLEGKEKAKFYNRKISR